MQKPPGRPGKTGRRLTRRDFATHALPRQRRRGREHFAHSGTAARPLIADDDDLALLVGFLLDRLKGILFPVEAAGRSGKFQVSTWPATFTIAPLRREISLQTDDAACGR